MTLKTDLAVELRGDDIWQVDFEIEVDSEETEEITKDGFDSRDVSIKFVWKLEAGLPITLDVTSEVTLGVNKDVAVSKTLEVTVDVTLEFAGDDLVTDVESTLDDGRAETTREDAVTFTDEFVTRIGVTLKLIAVLRASVKLLCVSSKLLL